MGWALTEYAALFTPEEGNSSPLIFRSLPGVNGGERQPYSASTGQSARLSAAS
jgi:hypothetical protein